MSLRIGDLVKFEYVNNHTQYINGKIGLYLGPRQLKREDVQIINNFAVLFLGDKHPTLCDGSMMRWLHVHRGATEATVKRVES